MAFDIDTTSLKPVRRCENYFPTDISTWGAALENSGTVTYEGLGNRTMICTQTATNSRLFHSYAHKFKAGFWYVVSFEITEHPGFSSGSSHARDLIQFLGATIDAGSKVLSGASVTGVGQYACKFKADTTETQSVRVGVGCDTSENQMADGVLKIESVMLEEFPFEPDGPDTYRIAGTTTWLDVTPSRVVAGDEGAVTAGTSVQYDYSKWSFGISIGDSFGNGANEFPEVIDIEMAPFSSLHNPTLDYDHVSGETTTSIAARMDAAIKAPVGVKPGFVIMQASVNSVSEASETSAQAFASLQSMITTCNNNGIPDSNIIVINLPPWGNGGQDAGELAETDALNALIAGLTGVTVYDMYSALEGDANPDDLSKISNGDTNDYDSGDGLHPNTGVGSGSERIGQDISALIAAKWEGSDSGSVVSSVVSQITASVVSSVLGSGSSGETLPAPIAHIPLATDLVLSAGVGSAVFSRAQTASYIDQYDGLLKTVASGSARFESTGILIEGASDNLQTYSEEFDNAAWSKSLLSVTANNEIAIDNTTTMDLIIPDATNGSHEFQQFVSVTSGTDYTQTIYAKSGGYDFLQITGSTGFDTEYVNFDLSDGSIGNSSLTTGTASIKDMGFGIYRCRLTLPATSTTTGGFAIAILNADTGSRLPSYAGDTTSGVNLWGGQFEDLPLASSYIKTTSASVSRPADDLGIDSDNIPAPESDYSVTFEADTQEFASPLLPFLYGTVGELKRRMYLAVPGSSFRLQDNAVTLSGATSLNTVFKVAVTKNSSTISAYIDGALEDSDTPGTITGTKTQIDIGGVNNGPNNYMFGHVKNFKIYDKTLTADEVATL